MSVQRFRISAAVLALLTMAACSSPNALEGWNDNTAAMQVNEQLRAKGFSMGEQHSCSEWFELSPSKVLDVSLPGGSGMVAGVVVEAEVTTPVRAKEAIMEGARLAEFCYGWPRGGWSAGQSSNYVHTFAFRRWRSGWKLVAESGR